MKENDKTERKNKNCAEVIKGLDLHQKMAFVIGVGLLVFVLLYAIPRGIIARSAQEMDVLSFYGSVLGAVVTVATIAITISFNRKQIQRDAYLKSEVDRWTKIDEAVSKALEDINPQCFLQLGLDEAANGNVSALNQIPRIAAIQKYRIQCSIATDRLYSCMSSENGKRLEELLVAFSAASKEFSDIAHSAFWVYADREVKTNEEQVMQMREIERNVPNALSEENRRQLACMEEQISEFKEKQIQGPTDSIEELNQKMCAAYENTYRPLLALKGRTFDAIYRSIQSDADKLLFFWMRK